MCTSSVIMVITHNFSLGKFVNFKLKLVCNFTSSCEIRKFKFEDFPSHVTDLDIKAYKPVCIQIILKQHQAVFWSDANRYFVASNIDGAIKHAQKTGFSAWTLDSKDSTSTLTHPKMFGFFNTKPEDYHFHRMVEANNLILYNTQVIQDQLMLPWVQCALVKDCVAPYGAQATGCSFIYKPRYKYSGCHRYEMSGLNIILGQVFKQNESQYTVDDVMFGTRERFFNLTRTIKSVSKS
ncbi:uncharacterized protein LOC106179013 [Lingula anatina]|uniref:Uncharacterized protein LOC106179013 n=1 Tax=Lingula anatina TaxID=7574 RepID=A0A1S3K5L1_LINAN|nr:uncharacterized protein LOC106179013 [Lingula anatina]|eukprot:XP_013417923.1 uncharacterized protein LOC106179013 [Lingula anatina]